MAGEALDARSDVEVIEIAAQPMRLRHFFAELNEAEAGGEGP